MTIGSSSRVSNRGGTRGFISGRTNRGRGQSGRSRGGTRGVQQGRIERRPHSGRTSVLEHLRGLPDGSIVHPASSASLRTGGTNFQDGLLRPEDITRLENIARDARARLQASENTGPDQNREDTDQDMTGIETGHPTPGRAD